MTPGDIVLIRFPQTDLQTGKLRPALIISSSPGRHPDLLLALISSRVYQAIADFDEIIEVEDGDYPGTGLKVRSVIRLFRLATVEASVINARLGISLLKDYKKSANGWQFGSSLKCKPKIFAE